MIPGRKTAGKFFPIANPNLNLDLRGPYLPGQVTFARNSVGYYIGSNGFLQEAAINEPRFEYDPVTLAPLGLLVEPTATYLATRSTEMDNGGYWARSNNNVVPAARVGIDGTLSMYQITVVATSATIFFRQLPAAAATQYATVRVAKGNTATSSNVFGAHNSTAGTAVILFTLNYDTGVITHSVGSGATATSVGNGIWEIRFPVTGLTIGNTINYYCGSIGLGQTAGDYFYASHYDVSDKPNASHMPTAGANVVRGADVATVPVAAITGGFDYKQGTIAVRGNYNGGTAALPSDRAMLSINTAAEYSALFYNSTAVANSYFSSIGTSQFVLGPNASNAPQAAAASFTQRGFNTIAQAGSAASSSNVGANVLADFATFGIGSRPVTADKYLIGHISGLRYWKYDCDPKMVTYLSSDAYWSQS